LCKNYLKNRNSLTFKQFASNVLGKTEYNKFIKTFGYSDFENADFVDTVDNYGFDEYLEGTLNYFVPWDKLISKLYDLLKDNIELNSTVDKIIPNRNSFTLQINNNHYDKKFDKIVISTYVQTTKKLLNKLKIYDNIETQPFARLYVKLDKKISEDRFIITDKPFQKIILMNQKENIYMISYSDNDIAKQWLDFKHIKTTVEENIKKIFNDEVEVLDFNLQYWKYGTHFYLPLPSSFENRESFIEEAQHPYQNIYVAGEMISNRQGNCEGAVRSVEKLFELDCF